MCPRLTTFSHICKPQLFALTTTRAFNSQIDLGPCGAVAHEAPAHDRHGTSTMAQSPTTVRDGIILLGTGDFTPCHVAGQVEQKRLNISSNVPVAVQQWEGLIAINYPARAAGITRHMRVHEAKALCPELQCVHVETIGASLCSTSLSDPDYILGRLMSNETSALPMYNASSAPNNT